MKVCRYGDQRLGVVVGDEIADVTGVLDALPSFRYPLPRHDPFIEHLDRLLPAMAQALPNAVRTPLASARWLSPVANPGKLVAAPVNYRKHLQEVLGDANLHHSNQINEIHRAGLFLKATSSLTGMGCGVTINQPERRTDHEIELAVVIGRRAKDVAAKDALQYVAGYTMGLDTTIRGPEERSMRKSPDTYSMLGPWLVTPDELPDAGALDFELRVNGQLRQSSNTRELILGVPELIEFATRFYTLEPGDVIFTGTCEGVGEVRPGDSISLNMSGIGAVQIAVLDTQRDAR